VTGRFLFCVMSNYIYIYPVAVHHVYRSRIPSVFDSIFHKKLCGRNYRGQCDINKSGTSLTYIRSISNKLLLKVHFINKLVIVFRTAKLILFFDFQYSLKTPVEKIIYSFKLMTSTTFTCLFSHQLISLF
jgi:hypothetical protein